MRSLRVAWAICPTFRLVRCIPIALDADLLFQQHVEGQAVAWKNPARHEGLESRQFYFYNSPGRLLREHGRWVLRVARSLRIRQLWQFYGPGLLAYT